MNVPCRHSYPTVGVYTVGSCFERGREKVLIFYHTNEWGLGARRRGGGLLVIVGEE